MPPGHQLAVLDVREKLTYLDTRVVSPFEYIALEGSREAYDFYSRAPTILLRLFRQTSDELHHIYDRANLRPWLVQAGEPASTQIVCLARALARLGAASSLPGLDEASNHPHHFVRWAAIQAMSAIDRTRALDRVQKALADPHPDVRDAARRSLEKAAAARDGSRKGGLPWH
jgi:hypothetical protein